MFLAQAHPKWILAPKCLCGTALCRGLVTGNDWKRKDLQKKYGRHFLSYVLEQIDAENVSARKRGAVYSGNKQRVLFREQGAGATAGEGDDMEEEEEEKPKKKAAKKKVEKKVESSGDEPARKSTRERKVSQKQLELNERRGKRKGIPGSDDEVCCSSIHSN